MQILLVNDTGSESNPGCRAVSSTLRELFIQDNQTKSIPVGSWADEFQNLPGVRRKCVLKHKDAYPTADESVASLDLAQWREIGERLWKNDNGVKELLSWADLVIINGEGSIHHNFPRGVALLSLALCCALQAKPIYMLNSTIMAMDKALLGEALASASLIHVRGTRSKEALPEKLHPLVRVAPDVVCAANYLWEEPDTNEFQNIPAHPPSRYCLYAPGVASTLQSAENVLQSIQAEGYIPLYLKVGDKADIGLWEALSGSSQLETLDLTRIDWRALPQIFSRFPGAVSGRHHLNIFLARGGVPFIALPSNTWKIEETLEGLALPVEIARSGESVRAFVRALSHMSREQFMKESEFSFRNARTSILSIRDEFMRMVQ